MRPLDPADPADPVARWAASGAMALTGRRDGPALGPPAGLVPALDAVAAVVHRRAAEHGAHLRVDPLALLGERAAIAGLGRNGSTSCGGATRLLPAGDGWLAVSLARPDDVELVPAWLERPAPPDDVWDVVADAVAGGRVAALVTRGATLGLPLAALPGAPTASDARDPRNPRSTAPSTARATTTATTTPGATTTTAPAAHAAAVHAAWPTAPAPLAPLPLAARRVAGPESPPRGPGGVRVVDLSPLWAGPLCAGLLAQAGADVVKVESTDRPDGARRGPSRFFDLLNAGKRSVALDLRSSTGRQDLAALIAAADVVVEGSRPRALAQLGIDADRTIGAGGPRVWLSITGHGRTGAGAERVAFGDDAAVAGGLVSWDADGPCFTADAVADPVTGLVAAAAALDALAVGGRWLLDVALAGVAAHLAVPARGGPAGASTLPADPGSPVAPPRARPSRGRAPYLGEHTGEVLAEWTGRSGQAERSGPAGWAGPAGQAGRTRR